MVLGMLAAVSRCQGDTGLCFTEASLGLDLAEGFWRLQEAVAALGAPGEP